MRQKSIQNFSRIFIVLLALFIASCQTNPPSQSTAGQPNKVEINVSANVDGASIFVDDVNTNLLTPATIEVSKGTHTIRLEINGYLHSEQEIITDTFGEYPLNITVAKISNKIVLIEDFANVSCAPCVESNKILHDLSDKSYYKENIVVIKYPTNFPSSIDPFYLAAKEEATERIKLYNILFAPTVIVNGIQKPIATDEKSIKTAVEDFLITDSPFDISITKQINGSEITADVSVTTNTLDGITRSDLVLQIAILETDIEYATAPGSNGETKFYHVMRDMLPNFAGTSLSQISIGQTNYTETIALQSQWDTSKLKVIAFIQNTNTKEIYQAVQSN